MPRPRDLMGARGWRLLLARNPTEGRMGWIAAALDDPAILWDKYTAEEFVMIRRVVD